ncbi:site-2 protease family protein [Candidatus Roizmanbacteria bacterium]|nr:site-2 protease family protein [Candidatus Roizmanbacteria bacterium]
MKSIFYIEMDEAKEILISVLAISLALAIANGGIGVFLNLRVLLILLVLFTITVGSGFILHEMAHKIVAIHYGAYARFQMWMQGLLLMLGLSFLGVVFAAPGAVYIYSHNITKKENGIISAAGPLTNILIALVFLGLTFIAPLKAGGFDIWLLGARVNAFLALFNMIPIFPLDGSKVFQWNWMAWLGVVLIAGGMLLNLGFF